MENEIWMIPVPLGGAQNDRGGRSQAGAQMSQRGVLVWEDRRGAQDGPGHPRKNLTNSHRNADIDKTSLGLTELGASI